MSVTTTFDMFFVCARVRYANFDLKTILKENYVSWNFIDHSLIIYPDQQYPRNWTGPVLAGHIAGLTNVGFDAAMHRLPIVEWRDLPDSWLGTGSRRSSGIRV